MYRVLFYILLLLYVHTTNAQKKNIPLQISQELNQNWQFKDQKENTWYKATVPGTVHTDLLANKLIPDPFYRDNESKLQWIDKADWEYRSFFDVDAKTYSKKNIELVFDGLDTYADVYLNGHLILQADNMFRGWTVNVKSFIKSTNNELLIRFASAQNKVDSIAKSRLPLILPDNNRVYVRKAQFQFGWDWGPKFVGSGIWKSIKLEGWNGAKISPVYPVAKNEVKLIQQKDSIGTSFYFQKDGKPIYAKGANWIPADVFLPRLTKADYRKMLLSAKDANMNMLRVWGGGVYESDDFYDLCDSLGIMVWQDFMFAGGMYPCDDAFMNNVREEVKYQVNRLKHHPCIVLWCGNNEVEEAWKNWGWQKQFNLHGTDSAKVWNDYKRLFQDSLKKWVDDFDGTRPYVSTSPKNGWGHAASFTEGDSHYWGVWWGLEDWEAFENKTGRFVSEYGMQAMPNWNTIKGFTDSTDRYLYSPVIRSHQKASDGFKKLDHYLTRYFIDSAKLSKLSLEDYTYLSQCMQYYILKNSIAVHRSKYPANMGTLLWQLNDCWPVTSWSITDYSRQPKAAWYAVKEAYRDNYFESKFEGNLLNLKLHLNELSKYKIATYRFYSPDNKLLYEIADTLDSEIKMEARHFFPASNLIIDTIEFQNKYNLRFRDVVINATCLSNKISLLDWNNSFSFNYPKFQKLQKPEIIVMPHDNFLQISSNTFTRFVYLEMDGVKFSDNYFDLLPNTTKIIRFSSNLPIEEVYKNFKIKSLYAILFK